METLTANLLTVCSRCHRHIHKGILTLTGQAPGTLTWTDRTGRPLGTGVTTNRWTSLTNS